MTSAGLTLYRATFYSVTFVRGLGIRKERNTVALLLAALNISVWMIVINSTKSVKRQG